MFDSFNQRKDIFIQGNMSFIQKFRPRKYILDSWSFISARTQLLDSLLSNDISHEICIKQNCIFVTSYNTLKNLCSLDNTYYRWENQSIFLKNQLHGNISLRFGLEITEGFSECITQHLFQKCFTKCWTILFDDVTQNCDFLCFSLKQNSSP